MKWFSCKICKKEFRTEQGLKCHQTITHKRYKKGLKREIIKDIEIKFCPCCGLDLRKLTSGN